MSNADESSSRAAAFAADVEEDEEEEEVDEDTRLVSEQHAASVSEMNDMRHAEILTDVKLKCQGRVFPAHRCLLSSASPYFRAMFQAGTEEFSKAVVEIRKVSAPAMDIVLDFLYTGQVPLVDAAADVDSLAELWSAAEYLQADRLADHLLRRWERCVSCKELVRHWTVAERYQCAALSEKLIKRFVVNFAQMCTQASFVTLTVAQLGRVLSHPDMRSLGEVDHVVGALLEWAKHAENDRRASLKELVALVDLHRLSVAYLDRLLDSALLIEAAEEYDLSELREASAERDSRLRLSHHLVTLDCNSAATFDLSLGTHGVTHRMPFVFGSTMTATCHEGRLYVVGGMSADWLSRTVVLRYCPFSNVSSTVGRLNRSVVRGGAAVLGGYLYVLSGSGECSAPVVNVTVRLSTNLQRLSVASGECETLAAPAERNVSFPFVVGCNHLLIAAFSQRHATTGFEVYSPFYDQWTELSNTPACRLWPMGRNDREEILVARMCERGDEDDWDGGCLPFARPDNDPQPHRSHSSLPPSISPRWQGMYTLNTITLEWNAAAATSFPLDDKVKFAGTFRSGGSRDDGGDGGGSTTTTKVLTIRGDDPLDVAVHDLASGVCEPIHELVVRSDRNPRQFFIVERRRYCPPSPSPPTDEKEENVAAADVVPLDA